MRLTNLARVVLMDTGVASPRRKPALIGVVAMQAMEHLANRPYAMALSNVPAMDYSILAMQLK